MNTIKGIISDISIIVFAGLVFYGYAMNLVYLFNLQVFSGELVLRAVGVIIPPLGAILGFV